MAFLKTLSQRLFGGNRAEDALDEPDKVEVVSGRPVVGVSKADNALPKLAGGSPFLKGTAGTRSPLATLEMICDLNPDASLAIWNFLRLVNPDHKLSVYEMPERTKIDKEGQQILVDRTDGLLGSYGKDYGGGLGQLINVLTLTLVTQGAIAGEVELNDSLNEVLDWCPVSPSLITLMKDPERNEHIVPVIIYQGNSFLLPTDQFRYIPLDPSINNPYGRSPIWPALESVFFQVEVLRDLKMVAHITGHPRMHISLLEEVIEMHVPARYNKPGNEEQKRTWMDNYLSDVANQYKNLEPDDGLFTWDWVKVSGLDAGRPAYNITNLVQIVETQVIAALKQLPILLGRIEGSGLAHGTVQWQIYAKTIEALRKPVALMASWWGTQTLRILGRESVCDVTFPTIRTQDRVKEATAEITELQATLIYLSQGWIDQEEASETHVGHAPVSEPLVSLADVIGAGSSGTEEQEQEEGVAESEPEPEPGRFLERRWGEIAGLSGLAGDNGNNERDFGLGVSGPESKYFRFLPLWMKARIRATVESVDRFAMIRRSEIISEFEEDE